MRTATIVGLLLTLVASGCSSVFSEGKNTFAISGAYMNAEESQGSMLDTGAAAVSMGRFVTPDVEIAGELRGTWGPAVDSYIAGIVARYYFYEPITNVRMYGGAHAGYGVMQNGDDDWVGVAGPLLGILTRIQKDVDAYVEYRNVIFNDDFGPDTAAADRADSIDAGVKFRF